MKVLIGYSMRSGSTLLQHMLSGHECLRASGDLSSTLTLPLVRAGAWRGGDLCVKPPDWVFLSSRLDPGRGFDRFVWLTRDPRDSYLSALRSGYAYWLWPRGPRQAGIDLGLLDRWQRIHRQLFQWPERWYLLRYEDLVTDPLGSMNGLLDHLGLPRQDLRRFGRYRMAHGGDWKIRRTREPNARSVARHVQEMSPAQRALFRRRLGPEMRALGYPLREAGTRSGAWPRPREEIDLRLAAAAPPSASLPRARNAPVR